MKANDEQDGEAVGGAWPFKPQPIHDPSQETRVEWLQRAANARPLGRWLFFFPEEEVGAAWARGCAALDLGELGGVQALKVRTAKPDGKGRAEGEKVILATCGGSRDSVRGAGERLVRALDYRNSNGKAYFRLTGAPGVAFSVSCPRLGDEADEEARAAEAAEDDAAAYGPHP